MWRRPPKKSAKAMARKDGRRDCSTAAPQGTQAATRPFAFAFALPAEVGLHLDFFLALRYTVQLPDELFVAVCENADLTHSTEDGTRSLIESAHPDIATPQDGGGKRAELFGTTTAVIRASCFAALDLGGCTSM